MCATRIDGEKFPVAVLFSRTPQAGNGWEKLSDHSCGGFCCNSLDGWAYLLPLRDSMRSIVLAITEEDFCEGCANTRMDYLGSLEDYQEQQNAYRVFLAKHGLSVSSDRLARLQQAAYPLDASLDNLRALVGDSLILSLPDGVEILFLGHNCD